MPGKVFKETESYTLREMELGDYSKGFLSLLSQLTTVPPLSLEQFSAIFSANQGVSSIVVAESRSSQRLVGTFKIMFDHKYSRGGGVVAHLEDVVVDREFPEAEGLGRDLMDLAKSIAETEKCYKIIGNCDAAWLEFFARNGFQAKDICFRKVF